tara:strand:+ start:835 stop:1059 length:225 start_codon:yes stop_codon:yes gene_type:complete
MIIKEQPLVTLLTKSNRGVRMIETASFVYVLTYKQGVRQVHGSDMFDFGYWTGTKWQFDTMKEAKSAAKEFLKK